MTTTDDRESLIRAYLDGSATDEQIRELDRLLEEDASLRRTLLNESAFDAQLRVILQRQWRVQVPASSPRFWYIALAAAAGLAVAVGVAWYSFTMRSTVSSVPARVAAAPRPAVSPVVPPVAPVAPVSPVALPVVPPPVPEVATVQAVGVLTRVQGAVSLVSSRQREGVAARERNPIAIGDTLLVGSNAQASVEYADGSRLIVYARSRLSFEPSAAGKFVRLERGALDADIVPQPPDAKMVLYTAWLTAEVVGTQFRLIDNGKASWLAVRTGLVRVSDNAKGDRIEVRDKCYAMIGRGQTWGPFPATTCPDWKAACKAAVGSKYP